MKNQVKYSVSSGIATITLNRPDALNALQNSMIAAIGDGIHQASADSAVRVLVLEGAGRTFCAGDDLIEMGTENHPRTDDTLQEYLRGYPALVAKLRAIEKPVICKVQRYALGAGLEMALACDFIIAENSARVGLPFVLRGIAAGTALLPSLVPRHIAARMLYTGEMVTALQAEQWGLIYKTVDPSDLDTAVAELASELSRSATRAIGLMKGAIVAGQEAHLGAALRLQASATVSSALTLDFAEGAKAFAQKREPDFSGR